MLVARCRKGAGHVAVGHSAWTAGVLDLPRTPERTSGRSYLVPREDQFNIFRIADRLYQVHIWDRSRRIEGRCSSLRSSDVGRRREMRGPRQSLRADAGSRSNAADYRVRGAAFKKRSALARKPISRFVRSAEHQRARRPTRRSKAALNHLGQPRSAQAVTCKPS